MKKLLDSTTRGVVIISIRGLSWSWHCDLNRPILLQVTVRRHSSLWCSVLPFLSTIESPCAVSCPALHSFPPLNQRSPPPFVLPDVRHVYVSIWHYNLTTRLVRPDESAMTARGTLNVRVNPREQHRRRRLCRTSLILYNVCRSPFVISSGCPCLSICFAHMSCACHHNNYVVGRYTRRPQK
jgi:hypothetical protein